MIQIPKQQPYMPISLSQLKQTLQMPIIKLKQLQHKNNYYQVITVYGSMCLIIQQYRLQDSTNIKQWLMLRNSTVANNCGCFPLIYEHHVIQYKNIYMLSIVLMEDCLPLALHMQPTLSHQNIKTTAFSKLIQSMAFLEQSQLFAYNQDIDMANLLFFRNSQQIGIDFTLLSPALAHGQLTQRYGQQQNGYQRQQDKSYLGNLIRFIKEILGKKYNSKQIKQIIFIKGKIYGLELQKLDEVQDYQQLLFYLNLCANSQVQLISKSVNPNLNLRIPNLNHSFTLNGSTSLSQSSSLNGSVNINANTTYLNVSTSNQILDPKLDHSIQLTKSASIESPVKQPNTKIKKVQVRQLQNNPKIRINQKVYENLKFMDGKCINSLRQIQYQELKQKFIKDGALYKLQQFEHLVVNIFKNQSQARQQDIVTVYPPVSKVDLIGFLIAYIQCLQPTIRSIQYIQNENTLKLIYENRRKEQKYLRMVFYEQYIVKDEQISMIIQKSNIEHCKLDLQKMKISDSFLIFLSHFEKTSNIQQIYLSDNYGLTDVGLSTLLKSPYTDNIRTLCLNIDTDENNLLQESQSECIELISKKRNISRLYIRKRGLNNSIVTEQIDVSALNLIELESLGVKVTLNSVIKQNLKILRVDQMVSVQQLRNIKHLRLVQLKVRLSQIGKKSLIDSISGFTSLTSSLSLSISKTLNTKPQAVRVFAQGESKNTLRKLDLSYSNCKFKTLHPMFVMNQLQNIVLDGCINLGNQYEPISPKILSTSFSNIELTIQQLLIVLYNHKQLVELNITNTKITKYQILRIVCSTTSKKKMYITNLIISEFQYTNKLLEMANGYQFIGSVQLELERLLEPQQEYSLNSLISKGIKLDKTIRFRLNSDNGQIQKDQKDRDRGEKKKQVLLDRIYKYLIMSNSKVQSLQNFYINKMRISELLQLQQNFQVDDFCQSSVASSVTVTINGCKISSSPKIITQKYVDIPIVFKVLQKQTIDKLTHRFVKYMQYNYNEKMGMDLSNNKLIGKQIFNIFHVYGKNLIRELNFKGCMFRFDEVIDTLFQFNGLEMINQGQYQIKLNKSNFSRRSQQYIKLFMRIKYIKQLRIQCQYIDQVQILFSVLDNILERTISTIQSLTIIFNQIALNRECIQFFKLVFCLTKLNKFQFVLRQLDIVDGQCSEIWCKNINDLKQLQKLYLSIPTTNFPQLQLTNLKQVCIQYDCQIEENMVNKSIKSLTNSRNLKIFKLSLANCINISNLNRVFGLLPVGFLFEKLTQLEYLGLNFQFCPLKDQSLIDLLNTFPKCQKLKIIQLNVSFAITNFGEFINCIEHIVDDFSRPVGFKVICVTQNSRNFLLQTQNLAQKGVQFIL